MLERSSSILSIGHWVSNDRCREDKFKVGWRELYNMNGNMVMMT